MCGGLESRCVGRVYGADGAVRTTPSAPYTGFSLQPGHYSSLTAPNLRPTTNKERNDQCGNQHYSREILVMGMVMPETC